MIDIIIPVYNAERFLKRCVNSVLMQTNPNWNMILVDDGSIDNSGNLCDFYAEKYGNITSIHKPNGGVSSARNAGIDKSNNEYIMFVDSDDWVRPDLLEKLFSKKSEADVIVGGYAVEGIPSVGSQMLPDRYLTIEEIGEVFQQMIETNLANSPFSKVYRRSIIGNQRFDETVALGEDFLFNLDYFRKCKTMEIVECDSYIYDCTNTESATTTAAPTQTPAPDNNSNNINKNNSNNNNSNINNSNNNNNRMNQLTKTKLRKTQTVTSASQDNKGRVTSDQIN